MLQTGIGNDRRCRKEELDCSWEGLLNSHSSKTFRYYRFNQMLELFEFL